MQRFAFKLSAHFARSPVVRIPFGAGLLAICLLATGIHAQTPTPPPAPSPHESPIPAQSETKVAHPEELLAKIGKLYYSYAAAGLDGFDCAVHPDWTRIAGALSKNAPGTAEARHIELLSSVKLKLHVHLTGASDLDWNDTSSAGDPLDADSMAELSTMHQATQQTIQSFLQFWAPFMQGAVMPDSPHDAAITQSANEYTIVVPGRDSTISERFDSKLVLQQFHITENSTDVDFAPSYKATPQGLVVNSFVLRIQPQGAVSSQTQEMHFALSYQTIEGFPIPSKLSMTGTQPGNFDFALDGCTLTKQMIR